MPALWKAYNDVRNTKHTTELAEKSRTLSGLIRESLLHATPKGTDRQTDTLKLLLFNFVLRRERVAVFLIFASRSFFLGNGSQSGYCLPSFIPLPAAVPFALSAAAAAVRVHS